MKFFIPILCFAVVAAGIAFGQKPVADPKVATDIDKPQIRVPESEAQFLLAVKFTERYIERGASNPAIYGWEEAAILLRLYHGEKLEPIDPNVLPNGKLRNGPSKDFYTWPPGR